MTAASPGPSAIRFGVFEADLRTEELRKSGRKLRLPNQSFRVLAMLLNRAGQLVTREELRAQLWPAGTFVEYDQGLNAAVNRLREALGDSAEEPRFIETLPKRGYRFIAPIEPATAPLATPDHPADVSSEPADISSQPAVAAPASANRGGMRVPRSVLLAVLGAVLVIAGAIVLITSRPPADRPLGREVVPFTSLPGQEIAPTFSPDGSQVAFAWNGETGDDDRFDLYVKSIGSERLLRLTQQPAKWISPAWSPDGSSIAFVRLTDMGASLVVIPALGGSERRIVSAAVSVGPFIQISWSPDGSKLAYSAYGPGGAQHVNLAAVDTLSTEPLAAPPECLETAQPAFSPDGRQLALVCTTSSAVYAIYIRAVPEGSLRRLASMMGYPRGLAWSADGSRLIFSNDSGSGGELWQLTLDGQLAQLPFGEDGSSPAVAAKGDRIAYTRGRSVTNIWRVDLTPTNPEQNPEQTAQKLIYSTRAQVFPRYSHDGMRIAFQSNRSGSTEIWTTDAQGADPVRLTSFQGPFTSAPSWCSDGRRIAFDSRAAGLSTIYIEDIDERLPRKVATSHSNLSLPVWSKDCRWLFASDGNNVLYRFPSVGGPAQRFTDRPSYYAVVVGSRLVFNAMEEDGVVLWTKPVNGGREEPLANMPRLSYTDAWTATATGIYYTDCLSKPRILYSYDFTDQTVRRIMTLRKTPEPGGGFGIAVSPDNHWLLYTEIEDQQSDIMLGPSP